MTHRVQSIESSRLLESFPLGMFPQHLSHMPVGSVISIHACVTLYVTLKAKLVDLLK